MADAEDAVQEAYLRWHAVDRDRVSDPRAFLMTTTTRICLDILTSARARREDYTLRFAAINGLPGIILDGPEGPLQTTAFEIEGDVIRALYVVRNPDKLRHLGSASAPEQPDINS